MVSHGRRNMLAIEKFCIDDKRQVNNANPKNRQQISKNFQKTFKIEKFKDLNKIKKLKFGDELDSSV